MMATEVEESIYNLIPKPVPSVMKQPRFIIPCNVISVIYFMLPFLARHTSKFCSSVRDEVKQSKSPAKTMVSDSTHTKILVVSFNLRDQLR